MKTLKTCNSVKKRVQRRCFPVNFAKFLRTPFCPHKKKKDDVHLPTQEKKDDVH